MILVVSRDQLPYNTIMWSTAVYHEKYTAPCYRVEYDNSDRIKGNLLHLAKGFHEYVYKCQIQFTTYYSVKWKVRLCAGFDIYFNLFYIIHISGKATIDFASCIYLIHSFTYRLIQFTNKKGTMKELSSSCNAKRQSV